MNPSPSEAGAALADLVRGDLSVLAEVARAHGALLLVLFGSTATGKRHAGSDLDLAVLYQGPPPEEGWWDREIALEVALEDLLRPVCPLNLVALNRASELLQKEVADHGRVLYADEPDRWLLYRIRAYRNYEDTEKYRRRRWLRLLEEYGVDPDVAHATGQDRTA